MHERKKFLRRAGTTLVLALIILAVPVALCGWAVAIAPSLTTDALWGVRSGLYVIVLLALGLVAMIAMVRGGIKHANGRRAWPMLILTLVSSFSFGSFIALHGLAQAQATASYTQVLDASETSSMGPRDSYELARSEADWALGAPGSKVRVHTVRFTDGSSTLIWDGARYGEVVQRTGGVQTVCRFSPAATATVGGWFGRNLVRQIDAESFGLKPYGVYSAFCGGDDGTTPYVIVPLKKQGFRDWLAVAEEPAGFALYSGRTGSITFTDGTDLPDSAVLVYDGTVSK